MYLEGVHSFNPNPFNLLHCPAAVFILLAGFSLLLARG